MLPIILGGGGGVLYRCYYVFVKAQYTLYIQGLK